MSNLTATAVANANIAFIKYWGNTDSALRLPQNGSLSMNLAGLHARTRVAFSASQAIDELVLNGRAVSGPGLERVSRLLDEVRRMAQTTGLPTPFARVESANNFPTAAGIASSAAAFAALSLAATRAIGLHLSEAQLSRLARRGSGSACRSIPGGFVEWQVGTGDQDSYAVSIAAPDHWNLIDCIAVVSSEHKPVGSTEGHALANSSPFQAARVSDAARRLQVCRTAILQRDFNLLAEIVEEDSLMMHAVMMTSHPSLLYWAPASLAVMRAVKDWRRDGLPACCTVDAGPNVHVICPAEISAEMQRRLQRLPGVKRVLTAGPGGPTQLSDDLPA
jgi:diphosphomevalonate decarboxylase